MTKPNKRFFFDPKIYLVSRSFVWSELHTHVIEQNIDEIPMGEFADTHHPSHRANSSLVAFMIDTIPFPKIQFIQFDAAAAPWNVYSSIRLDISSIWTTSSFIVCKHNTNGNDICGG